MLEAPKAKEPRSELSSNQKPIQASELIFKELRTVSAPKRACEHKAKKTLELIFLALIATAPLASCTSSDQSIRMNPHESANSKSPFDTYPKNDPFDSAHRRDPFKSANAPKDPLEHKIKKAIAHMGRGESQKCIDILKPIYNGREGDSAVAGNLATCHHSLNGGSAVNTTRDDILTKLISLTNPQTTNYHGHRFNYHYYRGEFQLANAATDKALAINNADPFANAYKAVALTSLGQHQKAIDFIDQSTSLFGVALEPVMGWLYHTKALALNGLGRSQEACELASKAKRLEWITQSFSHCP